MYFKTANRFWKFLGYIQVLKNVLRKKKKQCYGNEKLTKMASIIMRQKPPPVFKNWITFYCDAKSLFNHKVTKTQSATSVHQASNPQPLPPTSSHLTTTPSHPNRQWESALLVILLFKKEQETEKQHVTIHWL